MRLILQLELPADARMLPKTRRAVDGYMEDLGSGPDERADVVLALDEACGNVIRHAFPAGADGVIRLRAEITDSTVTVQVEDDGVGFDPYSVTLDRAGHEDVSGRGLGIIRELMTTVELESPVTPSGGTRVRMEKVLGQDAESAP
ncbi:MAG TPA: ATP-binding protein [Acidimicrobiales bacterium]|nr:ATP-binding protein [Acidimicrobiales bacterium]